MTARPERLGYLPRVPRRVLGYATVVAVLVSAALVAAAAENDRFQSADFTVPDTLSESATTATTATSVAQATAPLAPAAAVTSTSASSAMSTTTSTVPAVPSKRFPTDRPLRVLIIGDSVAMSLTASRRETHQIDGFGDVEVDNVGNLACPVIEEGGWWFAAGIDLSVPAECSGLDRYESEIEDLQPDIVYALFGWTGGGGGQTLPDGSNVAPCQPEFDERWRDGYQNLITRLEQRVVVIVSTVAPADIDDEGHELPTKCLNAVVDQLDALVFDYGDWLCPDYDCSQSRDLRADRVHFTDIDELRRDVTETILANVLPLAGY